MKRFVIALLVSVLAMSGAAFAQKLTTVKRPTGIPSFIGYIQDEFILVLKEDAGKLIPARGSQGYITVGVSDFDAISQKYAVSGLKKQFKGSQEGYFSPTKELACYYKVKFAAGSLEAAMEAYRRHPMVDHVEPIGIGIMYATPNDYYFSYQWHITQANDHDIDGNEAWDIETGNDNIIVAILDTGVRYYHKDLGGANGLPSNPGAARGNMWINWTEKNGSSGVDDDGNGYVDDWIGYDFVNGASPCWSGEDCNTQDNDPRDFNGHGTHCAGNFGAITNDGYGMTGVAGGWSDGSQPVTGNGVKIMALRIGWSGSWLGQEVGYVRMDFAAEAFYYAADMGARIASCSWGSSNSGGLGAAVDYFLASGGLVFVAAGNSGNQTADYLNGRGDIVSVSATNTLDNGADFTTYGPWVDICAPGTSVWSTYHEHADAQYDYWASISGTSMSAPMAAGVAALIWSQNPTWTASQVENQLYSSADNIDAYLSSKYIGNMGAGRINAFNAVNTGPPPPVADFTGSPTSGCAPLTVNFTDLSTGDITSWDWDFGDDGTSTEQNPSHTYQIPGNYTVSLTVTGPSGSDTETKTDYISVTGAPTADFVGSPTSGTEPLTVSFSDLSTGSPTSWDWDFGDVGSSTQQNPTYEYTTAGTYTVTLTAANACGSDVIVKTDYITVNPCEAPTADFSGTPTTGCAPLTVSFTDLSIGDPTSWSWDFGDGGSSNEQNPTYEYTAQGTYTVTLMATNSCGSDGETKVDYIQVDPPCGAKVYALSDIPVKGSVSGDYTNTHTSDDVYEALTETRSGGRPSDRYSLLEHKWDFNVAAGSSIMFYVEAYRPDNSDGDDFSFEYSTDNSNFVPLVTVNSATEQAYSAPIPNNVSGAVYIRVVDTDHTQGNLSFDAVYVDYMYIEFATGPVPPTANFVGSPTSGPAPLTVNFTDQSSGNPTAWEWDFGDASPPSFVQHPTHAYNNPGPYTVALTVTNAYGSDTKTRVDYITVTEVGSMMHVHDMAVGRRKVAPNYVGTGTVTIYDEFSQPVSGATVYVTATGPTGGNYSDTTGADGTVYFETAEMKKPSGEWCFEVTDVTHASYTYDPADNNVTKACESGWVYGAARAAASEPAPGEFSLGQNYPNPFNPTTEIAFTLPQAAHVTLEIYNVLGQHVATLVDGYREAGEHVIQWESKDAGGQQVSSGIYLYRLQAGEFVEMKKMLLLK